MSSPYLKKVKAVAFLAEKWVSTKSLSTLNCDVSACHLWENNFQTHTHNGWHFLLPFQGYKLCDIHTRMLEYSCNDQLKRYVSYNSTRGVSRKWLKGGSWWFWTENCGNVVAVCLQYILLTGESKRMAPQAPLHIDTRDIFLQFPIIDVFSVGFRLIAVSKTDLKKQFYWINV